MRDMNVASCGDGCLDERRAAAGEVLLKSTCRLRIIAEADVVPSVFEVRREVQ